MHTPFFDSLLHCLTTIPQVQAVAVGGSSARAETDPLSDLDLFAFSDDADLILVMKAFCQHVSIAMPDAVVPAPYLSRGFGLRITVLQRSSSSAEVFFNSPFTFAPLPMARKMVFLNEAGAAYFAQHFPDFVATNSSWRRDLINLIFYETFPILRNMVKCIHRHEATGFHTYLSRFRTIMIALDLHCVNIAPFDPHLVETKLTKVLLKADIVLPGADYLSTPPSIDTVLSMFASFVSRLADMGATQEQVDEFNQWLPALSRRTRRD